MPRNSNKRPLCIDLPPDLDTELRTFCDERRTSLTSEICMAIRRHLDRPPPFPDRLPEAPKRPVGRPRKTVGKVGIDPPADSGQN
jgi:hypothetical protein